MGFRKVAKVSEQRRSASRRRATFTRLAAIMATLTIVVSLGLVACGGDDDTTTSSTTSTVARPDPQAFAQTLVADGYADDQKSAECATQKLLEKLSPEEIQAVLDHQADTVGPKGVAGLSGLEAKLSAEALTCSLQ